MTPEQEIQKPILVYLKGRGIWCKRFNTGRRAGVSFGYPGLADILCTPIRWNKTGGTISVVWLEVKTKTGKQNQDQINFQQEVTENGHYYFVVRSIDDVETVLKGIS
jgi:hypothetical protein